MTIPYYAGVVGSRRRNTLHDRKIVFRLVEWIVDRRDWRNRPIIVSGGCPQGADAFAEEAAKIWDLQMIVFPVDKKGVSSRWEFMKKAYERNRLVAERSTELYALVAPDRMGGTENTIGHMLDLKKPVYLVKEDGSIYLSKDGTETSCMLVTSLLGSNSTD